MIVKFEFGVLMLKEGLIFYFNVFLRPGCSFYGSCFLAAPFMVLARKINYLCSFSSSVSG